MRCKNCGRENLNDSKFCSQCGKPLRAGADPQKMQYNAGTGGTGGQYANNAVRGMSGQYANTMSVGVGRHYADTEEAGNYYSGK